MSRITIELAEAALGSGAWEERLLPFPDGVARLVSLRRSQWVTYDWLIEAGYYTASDIAWATAMIAEESATYRPEQDFEWRIRRALANVLKAWGDAERREHFGAFNDG